MVNSEAAAAVRAAYITQPPAAVAPIAFQQLVEGAAATAFDLDAVFADPEGQPLEVAATLRASPLDAFFSVAVPLARPGFLTASILTFAHTVGEFGVVLMIGGNLPGVTRVASVQIYDHVEAMEYAQAHRLSAVMLVFSFLVLLVLYAWRPGTKKGA